jgi:hypothetical protein
MSAFGASGHQPAIAYNQVHSYEVWGDDWIPAADRLFFQHVPCVPLLGSTAPKVTAHPFPYEQSEWHCGESERWLKALERYGPENVRAILAGPYSSVGSRAVIGIGTVMDIPKGFAQEWLAWHDQQKSEREMRFH